MPGVGNDLVSTPVELAISGMRWKSLPAALWWLLGRHLDLGRGMTRPLPRTAQMRGRTFSRY
jgi:hypothetical protein